MNIKKIQLLVTVKGGQVWEKGGVYSAPFPADLQGLLKDVRCVRILEIDKEVVNGTEENREEAKEGSNQEAKEEVSVKSAVKLKKKVK